MEALLGILSGGDVPETEIVSGDTVLKVIYTNTCEVCSTQFESIS